MNPATDMGVRVERVPAPERIRIGSIVHYAYTGSLCMAAIVTAVYDSFDNAFDNVALAIFPADAWSSPPVSGSHPHNAEGQWGWHRLDECPRDA